MAIELRGERIYWNGRPMDELEIGEFMVAMTEGLERLVEGICEAQVEAKQGE